MELSKRLIGSVSTQTNGTNMQTASTENTTENVILGTLGQSKVKKSQTMTYSAVAFLANRLAMREKNLDLTTPEGHSFLKLLGFSETKDPDIYYLKTSKVYLVTTLEKLSKQYLRFLPSWGINVNGVYLTAASSIFPKTESESLLSELIPGAKRAVLRFKNRNQKSIVGDYAFCIDVGDTGGVEIGGEKRKLTIEEKEQLQGFPIGFTEGQPLRQRHKMMGNAVSTNVITAIAKSLMIA